MKKIIEKLIADSRPELKHSTEEFVKASINFLDAKKKFITACGGEPSCGMTLEDFVYDACEDICAAITMSVDPEKETGKEFSEGLALLRDHLMS